MPTTAERCERCCSEWLHIAVFSCWNLIKTECSSKRCGMWKERCVLDFFTYSLTTAECDSTGKLLLTSPCSTACMNKRIEKVYFFLSNNPFVLHHAAVCRCCWGEQSLCPLACICRANYAKRKGERGKHGRATSIIDYFIIVIFCCLQSLLSFPLTALSASCRCSTMKERIKEIFS